MRKSGRFAAAAPPAPDDYWLTDDMADALRSRHIGQVIATYRRRPPHGIPLSQDVVGSWVGITQAHVSRLENGPPVKNLDKLVLWAQTLGIPEHVLWFSLPGREGAEREAGQPAHQPPVRPTPGGHGAVAQHRATPEGHITLADGTLVMADARETAPLLAEALLGTMQHYVTTDNLVGPRPLLQVVPQQIAYIEELLTQTSGGGETRLLYVGARYAEFAGWLYQDAGDLRSALQWSNVALEFARQTGEPQLTSYIWMRKSNIGSDTRRPHLALAFARAALEDADALTPRQRAVALRQEAHAHALAGDPGASARALDQAYAQASAPDEGDNDIARYCTPSYVEMEAAHCWIELERPDDAIATLQRGLAEWHPDFRRDLGLCLARLAVAHGGRGDCDSALAVAEHALTIAAETRSHRTTYQLSRVPAMLEAAGETEPARNLSHMLTTLR